MHGRRLRLDQVRRRLCIASDTDSKELDSAQARIAELEAQAGDAASAIASMRTELESKAESLERANAELSLTRDKCG